MRRSMLSRLTKTLTPESVHAGQAGWQIDLWCRLHRVDSRRCRRIVLVPCLRLAAFALCDLNCRGQFFVRGEDVAWRWHLRWLRLPPPADWTVEAYQGDARF